MSIPHAKHLLGTCVCYVRQENHAEMESTISTQDFIPGEIVDRDWFNR